jgi:hypothetical protein
MAHSPFRPDKRLLRHVRRHCGQLWSAIVFRPGRAKFYQAEALETCSASLDRIHQKKRRRQPVNGFTAAPLGGKRLLSGFRCSHKCQRLI